MAIASLCPLEMLPNELLTASLACLSARELILVAPVSRLFYKLIIRLLHRRLLCASSLPHNELILECYHPSAKISTPWLSCRYLGLKHAGDRPIVTGPSQFESQSPTLHDLMRLYSSYRPVLTEENRGRRSRNLRRLGDDTATQEVYLDEGELFSQLCTFTNVVKESARRGFFLGHVNTCKGVIRIWRQWLAERASAFDSGGEEEGEGSRAVDFDKFLWVDPARSVGLRFRVEVGPAERMPVLSGADEDSPVSYTLVYEELVIQTTSLLLAAEASAVQEVSRSSKAIVIAQV